MGPSPNKQPVLSARLDPGRVQTLLDRLTQQEKANADLSRRHAQRFAYHQQANIVVTIFHNDSSQVRYAVVARNLSESGLAFLHGGYIHVGTQCVAALETTARQWVRVVGKVVRCRHVEGNVHEVGINFRDKLQLSNFLSGAAEEPQERQTLVPRLVGRTLYVDDSPDDRDLMRFLLDRIGVKAITTASADEAIALIESKVPMDVLLIDHEHGGINGLALLQAVRQRGIELPVVIITADDSAALHRDALNAGCEAVLSKPVQLDQIASIMLQFLPLAEPEVCTDTTPIFSTFWSDQAMQPLILNFLTRLDDQVKRIQTAVDSDRTATMDQLLRLKGTAGGFGYPQISRAVQRIVQLDRSGVSDDKWTTEVKGAMELCRRACEVRRTKSAK